MTLSRIATLRMTSSLALATIGVLAGVSAMAHDVWLTVDKKGGQLTAQINNGDTDKRDIPDRNRVVSLDLVGPSGLDELRRPLTPGTRFGQPVLETKPFASAENGVIAIAYDNGFWINAPKTNAEINTTKLMLDHGSSAHWTVKYGKLLLGPGSYQRVLHTRLELVALKDPFALPVGQKLPVRLELDGKPLAGIQVAYGDGVTPIPDEKMPFVKTGSDGIAAIPLERKGAYLLTVDAEAPPLFKELSEHDHVYASLTFDTSK
jgi:uncharacterized GH25 family protein